MTPFAQQFDAAQHDTEWRYRNPDNVLDENFDDDDYLDHMKFETAQWRFV